VAQWCWRSLVPALRSSHSAASIRTTALAAAGELFSSDIALTSEHACCDNLLVGGNARLYDLSILISIWRRGALRRIKGEPRLTSLWRGACRWRGA